MDTLYFLRLVSTKPGQGHSSHLCTWRAARDRGELASGIETKKRGPKAAPPDPRDLEIQRLQRDNTRLEKRATRAEALVDIQKKVAALLGRPFESEDS
jgi:hypothetical protein